MRQCGSPQNMAKSLGSFHFRYCYGRRGQSFAQELLGLPVLRPSYLYLRHQDGGKGNDERCFLVFLLHTCIFVCVCLCVCVSVCVCDACLCLCVGSVCGFHVCVYVYVHMEDQDYIRNHTGLILHHIYEVVSASQSQSSLTCPVSGDPCLHVPRV